MTERRTRKLVSVETSRVREKVDSSRVSVFLINMEGEKDQSLHEPIGLEVIGGRLSQDIPGIHLGMYDTQPELVRKGKVDTDALAQKVRDFADDPANPSQEVVLGIGVPIYSWAYTESLLIKLEQDPPEKKVTIVLGNAIPTYTDPALLKEKFPHIKLVVGEGEEILSEMVQQLARGKEIEDSLEFRAPNITNDYAMPLRVFTQDILDLGGSAKAEASRGCDFGACTFCSRCVRAGKDYRTVDEHAVVAQKRQLLESFNATRFELTDEEAFGDLEATARLVSVMKADDSPRIPFVASLRVETINKLAESELLPQLQEVGLDKVFMGVEGGSDDFFQQMAKGQKMTEVRSAMKHVKDAQNLAMEMGFITFSWRMDMKMLRENIDFLSEPETAEYVSSLFNVLEVRAGTIDEKLLRQYSDGTRNTTADISTLTGYNPDEKFSINDSKYNDVPFLDPEVGRIYEDVEAFARADASLYYSVKSITRAASLPEEQHAQVQDFYLSMKDLHLQYLRNAVGLEEITDVPEQRRNLVTKIKDTFGLEPQGDSLDGMRREVRAFMLEETERQEAQGHQVGVLAVIKDDTNRVLLVRPRGQEDWALPGGNLKEGEEDEATLRRELQEELGVEDATVLNHRRTFQTALHRDSTTGLRPSLTLRHYNADLHGPINIMQADHEIADTLWLSMEDIAKKRVPVKENVHQLACDEIENRTQVRDSGDGRETVVFSG